MFSPLRREHHDDREQQGDERDRADPRDEDALIPVPAPAPDQDDPGQDPGDERDAEVDEHALRDLRHRDLDDGPLEPEPGRQHRDEHVGEDRVEQDLEDRVEGHEAGGVLGVAAREVVPHDDHRDAPGEPDQDEPGHVLRVVAQEDHRQREHQQRTDDPVLDQRQREDPHVPEDPADLLVADLRERRVHHQDQADRDRDRGRPHAQPVEEGDDPRDDDPEEDPADHGGEDPHRQIAVEQLEAALGGRCSDGRDQGTPRSRAVKRSVGRRAGRWPGPAVRVRATRLSRVGGAVRRRAALPR